MDYISENNANSEIINLTARSGMKEIFQRIRVSGIMINGNGKNSKNFEAKWKILSDFLAKKFKIRRGSRLNEALDLVQKFS